jgi:hypothetical protein
MGVKSLALVEFIGGLSGFDHIREADGTVKAIDVSSGVLYSILPGDEEGQQLLVSFGNGHIASFPSYKILQSVLARHASLSAIMDGRTSHELYREMADHLHAKTGHAV